MLVIVLGALPSFAAPVRRALVVAHNGSDRPDLPPLRFADDDGARWTEVLQRLGVEVTLLTVPDADTAQLEGAALARARPPSSAELDAAVAALAARNRADRAAGRSVDVVVIYVGHGQTDAAGRAHLTLLDGRLDRAGLYARVVDRLEADWVHLLVDACHAAGVVGRRGGDPDILGRLRATLEAEQLAQRPHVGALFAESDEGETHEWSRIRSGVFSHAARSGLLGGADVNGDGRVEYSELDAFVAAAIRGVKSARARLAVRTYAPTLQPARALVGPAPAGPVLALDAAGALARVSVEDTDGRRLADAHALAGERLALALPVRDAYWLRTPGGEMRVEAGALGRPLPALRPPELAGRGPEAEGLLRGLFAVPYGRAFYEGYVIASGLPAVETRPPVSVAAGAPLRGAVARPGGPSVALTAARAPLGGRGLARGVALAWMGPARPVALGVRAAYALAPDAWEGGASVQRAAVLAVAGVQGPALGPLHPVAEVGAGWLLTLVQRPGAPLQGDALGATARAAAGVELPVRALQLRVGATLDVDAVRVDGQRGVRALPGLEVGVRLR